MTNSVTIGCILCSELLELLIFVKNVSNCSDQHHPVLRFYFYMVEKVIYIMFTIFFIPFLRMQTYNNNRWRYKKIGLYFTCATSFAVILTTPHAKAHGKPLNIPYNLYQLVYFLTDRLQSLHLAPVYTISTQHTSPPVQSVAGRWIFGLQRFIHSPKCWAHGTAAVGAITS